MIDFVMEILLILILLTGLHFFTERPKLRHKLTAARHLYLISCQIVATAFTVIMVILIFGSLKANEAQTGIAVIVTFSLAYIGFYRLFHRELAESD